MKIIRINPEFRLIYLQLIDVSSNDPKTVTGVALPAPSWVPKWPPNLWPVFSIFHFQLLSCPRNGSTILFYFISLIPLNFSVFLDTLPKLQTNCVSLLINGTSLEDVDCGNNSLHCRQMLSKSLPINCPYRNELNNHNSRTMMFRVRLDI